MKRGKKFGVPVEMEVTGSEVSFLLPGGLGGRGVGGGGVVSDTDRSGPAGRLAWFPSRGVLQCGRRGVWAGQEWRA